MFRQLIESVIQAIGRVKWKLRDEISEEAKHEVAELLKPHYYIILTRRSNHLSTFFIGLSNLLLRGKWGYWSHSLMNLEDEVADPNDFRLIEAIGRGVTYSEFDKVFNVSDVVLLKPKNMNPEYWTVVLDRLKSKLGTPYDTLFDLKSESQVSCVELVRIALKAEPDYELNFANFERMISKSKNLTPQMFFDCPDFEVVWQAKKR
jgi:hypothetical protein